MGADGRTFQWNPCTQFKVRECQDTMVSDEKEAEMNLDYYFHSYAIFGENIFPFSFC